MIEHNLDAGTPQRVTANHLSPVIKHRVLQGHQRAQHVLVARDDLITSVFEIDRDNIVDDREEFFQERELGAESIQVADRVEQHVVDGLPLRMTHVSDLVCQPEQIWQKNIVKHIPLLW